MKQGDNKRIGILTLHFGTNYGAVFQAAAFRKFLDNLGYQPEVIDYRPMDRIIWYLKHLLANRHWFANLKKFFCFLKFIRSELCEGQKPFYRARVLPRASSRFSAIFTGSDEVWGRGPFGRMDPSYFLSEIAPGVKRSSFAASVGSSPPKRDHQSQIRRQLLCFDTVSCRDNHTRDFVRQVSGRGSVKLIDPALLVDPRSVFPGGACKEQRAYALVYGDLLPEEKDLVGKEARERRLSLVSTGYYFGASAQNHISDGPASWAERFYGSSRIFTTFYHGLILALHVHGRGTFFSRPDKVRKVKQLIEDLDLVVEPLTLEGGLPNSEPLRISFSSRSEELMREYMSRAADFVGRTTGEGRLSN